MIDRAPPSDVTAEAAVLGSLLLMPSMTARIAAKLTPENFYDPAHQKIYTAILELQEAGKPIDPRLVIAELKRRDKYAEVGGGAALRELTQAVANPAHCEYYADIVRRHAVSRDLIQACSETIQQAYAGQASVEATVAKLEQAAAGDRHTTVSVGESAKTILDELEQRKPTRRVCTGIPRLDDATAGLHPGQLTVLAAATGAGKSALALDIAYRLAQQGKRSLIVSLEMPHRDITLRLIQRLTGIPVNRILQAEQLTTTELGAVRSAYRELEELPIEILDEPDITVAQIHGTAKLWIARGGLDLLVVDYMQLLAAGKGKSQYERVTEVSRRLRVMTGQLDIPVLALAQLNREAKQKDRDGQYIIPDLHHLRESGQIEQDAHNVWFLHQSNDQTNERALVIRKQRQGRKGQIPLMFDPNGFTFEAVADRRESELREDFAEWAPYAD